ncbi:hypothetical protein [Glutamicibacter protophormiae]|uniref:hypothetical protein n=1 Tax=Glutamicibacter protophormiae TaxID=37930 RepID=UPI00195C80BB|nr:hypothetical protein [Glutamicibacter protophormiae]QRQ80165.1 hypothetical protein JQN66_08255 [Glutamicibacter protophormiae]
MEDISFLVAALGIEDPNEAVRIAEELYTDDDVADSLVSREDAPIVALEALEQARHDEIQPVPRGFWKLCSRISSCRCSFASSSAVLDW